MAHPRSLASISIFAITACILLGSGPARDAGLLPDCPFFAATAHALGPIVGYSRLPADAPPEPRLPVDYKAVQRWYEHEIAVEQARSARTLERIDLRFPERWPGERAEPHSAYQRAVRQEQSRAERALRELEREYRQRLR